MQVRSAVIAIGLCVSMPADALQTEGANYWSRTPSVPQEMESIGDEPVAAAAEGGAAGQDDLDPAERERMRLAAEAWERRQREWFAQREAVEAKYEADKAAWEAATKARLDLIERQRADYRQQVSDWRQRVDSCLAGDFTQCDQSMN